MLKLNSIFPSKIRSREKLLCRPTSQLLDIVIALAC